MLQGAGKTEAFRIQLLKGHEEQNTKRLIGLTAAVLVLLVQTVVDLFSIRIINEKN